jgi:tRNA threonylcarbamoyladenosine biosynthesis protein TsaE
MPAELVTTSAEETERLGERLGRELVAGDVVALTGELGAGKTCFTQGLTRGLGVLVRATSPTFVLVNEYRGRLPVHHVDAYRTGSVAELADLGLVEMMSGDAVTVIEWAEKLGPLLPPTAIAVHIDGVGDEPRRITITPPAGRDLGRVSKSRH